MAAGDALERLLQLVSSDGADAAFSVEEALHLLAIVRTTPDEGRALDRLLAAHAVRALPEALLVAVAAALSDRGDDTTAARALDKATSIPALLARAELHARAGDPAAAAATAERVLARDIDAPGARERHARWTREAGLMVPRSVAPTATSNYSGAEGVRRLDEAPFRVVRELARGGAGTVYEAEDRELGRRVALKVYHRPDRDRPQLLHEARVAVALGGEGVVRVFDVDVDQGWLAMQWVPLGSLGTHLRARRGPVLAALARWARSLAAGIARVHTAGWVHHDVKPANVLLAAFDGALLSDFGTARRRDEPSPPGSLGYVSPERLAGRASDPRDDVFGFGRVVQDALEACRQSGRDVPAEWQRLAAACIGPDEARPRDGSELVAILPSPD
jgi:eukaryotic-like serine/threonine-protein kinase